MNAMWTVAVVVLQLAVLCSCGNVVPYNGMVITEDTTFQSGTYQLSKGITIGADNVVLNMNGATLVGDSFTGFGITIQGQDNVQVWNGTIKNYFYGIVIQNSVHPVVSNNDLSNNYVDPLSKGSNPPWLDINVGPDLSDTTNLGGGLFMENVQGAVILDNTMMYGENGMDLFYVSESTVEGNDCSYNTGWGIHLHGSSWNAIATNTFNYNTRSNLGDSAGILVVNNSNHNVISYNFCQFSGDGFFIGNQYSCPSNYNLIQGNDCSFAGANAFEATFSTGNWFLGNVANDSNYGFWLGYSHDGIRVRQNTIANNNCGIQIEHGQNMEIFENTFANKEVGLLLHTDGKVYFPADEYPCLNLPNQTSSSGYLIHQNEFMDDGVCIVLMMTTSSTIYNNIFISDSNSTASADSDSILNDWNLAQMEEGTNIVGGPYLGGNYWSNYDGTDTNGDGIGDTDVPYTNNGQIVNGGDMMPLVRSSSKIRIQF